MTFVTRSGAGRVRVVPVHPTSRRDLVAAALAVADEQGLRNEVLVPPAVAARLAGVSRSTIYRHWPRPLDLNDALLAHALLRLPGWQAAIVAVDPARSLRDALGPVLAQPAGEAGVIARCAANNAALAYPRAIDGMRAELRWRPRFDGWVAAHLAAAGRTMIDGVEVTTLAGALAAVVEGAILLDVALGGPAHAEWGQAEADDVLAALDAIWATSTSPARSRPTDPAAAVDVPIEPEPGPEPSPGDAASDPLVAAIFAGLAGAMIADEPLRPAIRLVDVDGVAERAGITARWVYGAWPTTADHNAALIGAILDRHQDACTEVVRRATRAYLDAGDPLDPAAATALWRASIAAGSDPRRIGFAHAIVATRDPVMRAASRTRYEHWLGRYRMELLVLVHALGREVADPFGAPAFTRLVAGALLGASRMARTARVVGGGEDPLDRWAASLDLVVRSTTRPLPAASRAD
jgi:hypothetical protein